MWSIRMRECATRAHPNELRCALLEVTEAAFIEVGEVPTQSEPKCRRFADDS